MGVLFTDRVAAAKLDRPTVLAIKQFRESVLSQLNEHLQEVRKDCWNDRLMKILLLLPQLRLVKKSFDWGMIT
jgi:hypothetical protein